IENSFLPAARWQLSYRSPGRSTEARGNFCLQTTWRLEKKGVGGEEAKVKKKKKKKKSKTDELKIFLDFSGPFCLKERSREFGDSEEFRFGQAPKGRGESLQK
uniref:Uncharacterized protein n=1 Tax=Urocitellus parryii TaxID=9999 RepID=A0A8D2GZW8_UROPR